MKRNDWGENLSFGKGDKELCVVAESSPTDLVPWLLQNQWGEMRGCRASERLVEKPSPKTFLTSLEDVHDSACSVPAQNDDHVEWRRELGACVKKLLRRHRRGWSYSVFS